jgi:hypothetical protein
VNLGGDPGRDDFGLPPVDIEIPDDARELDRDVQAYHRELRAERRRLRARRLHGPLTRDGMVLPLLASCLVLALISGTLLTLFSAGQADVPGLPTRGAARPSATGTAANRTAATGTAAGGTAAAGKTASGRAGSGTPAAGQVPAGQASAGQFSAGRAAAGRTAAAGTAAAVGQIGGPLPDKRVIIAGKATRLRSLPPAVLALVPAGCQCTNAMRDLASEAATARVALYFVGTGAAISQLRRGQQAAHAGRRPVRVADDVHNVLGATYRHSGLTAILVHADGSVGRVAPGLRPGLWLTPAFMQLSSARSAGS